MGILDSLFNPQDAAGAGKLAAAFALLGQRGIGNAGMAGLQASQGFADRQNALKMQTLSEQMQRMQMEAMQRQQQDDQDLRGAFRSSVAQPQLPQTMDNRDVGQPGEQQLKPRLDRDQYEARLMQLASPQALQAYQSMQKDDTPMVVPDGATAVTRSGKLLFSNPKDSKAQENDFVRTMRAAGIDPSTPQGSQLLKNWLTKQTTHAPAATAISYGSPVPVVLPGGEIGYAQPPNRQGAAPQIMMGPGGSPLVKPKDEKPMTESQAKAAAFASQMQTAERELDSTPIDQSKIGAQAAVALSGGVGNFMVSPAVQRARQAQEQWAESYLRFKTGAASTEQEVIRNVKTFFPQPGDSKEVVAQKKRARQQAMADVGIAAGTQKPNSAVRKYNLQTGKIE